MILDADEIEVLTPPKYKKLCGVCIIKNGKVIRLESNCIPIDKVLTVDDIFEILREEFGLNFFITTAMLVTEDGKLKRQL